MKNTWLGSAETGFALLIVSRGIQFRAFLSNFGGLFSSTADHSTAAILFTLRASCNSGHNYTRLRSVILFAFL
jgi:hypothetical protein